MNQFPFLFGTPWPLWLIVVAGAGAGALTLRGYKRRVGEVKPGKLNLLKALRLTGWALLFLCLLEPIHRELVREEKASRLTVLLDSSESMSFVDSRNGPPRMATVKAALLGPDAAAALQSHPYQGGDKGGVKPDRGALLDLLNRSFKVQIESFGPSARAIANIGEAQPVEPATDIAKSLSDAFARLKGPDAGGLVLVSDGADTARGDLERVASAYKRAGTPVYVLGVGKPDLQDLAISQVRCRRTVSKDTLVRVEVDVSAAGLPDGKHLVAITRNGKLIGESKPVELKSHAGTAVFEFLPDAQGFLEYEAKVAPFPGELVTANNTMSFGVVAYSRKLRVLYMEGSMYVHRIYKSRSPGMYASHPMQYWWEHQFTERALLEDSDVELDVLAKGEFNSPQGADPLSIKTVKEAYPKTKKDLYQYDVIICGDIPYAYFTEDQVQWTVDFVAKHGGGFMMIGGYDSFAEGKYPKTPIDRMLPVEMIDEEHLERDFNWRLADEAWSHPIMQVEKDEEKNRAAWARLPQFHGFSRTTRPKPAATVLAVVADDELETAYGAAILLAVQPFGNGRSMAFTSDTTGSWGTEWEDSWGPEGETDLETRNKYFKTFMKNTIRWLAHYRMQAPNQLVTLESDRLVYGRGEEPEIRVKVMTEDYELTHDAKVQVRVVAPDGSSRMVSVFPKYEEPGIYERKLELGSVGRYEVEATATLRKDDLGSDKMILQVRPATAEMRQLSQNVDLLKRLADQTGGKYLPLERAAELPQYLREATHVIQKPLDTDLWNRSWVFAVIIALLCTEWFVRKRSGLP